MDASEITTLFSALAQPTRLAVFRLLVRHEPEGLPAGEIARLLDVPHNTMSSHLGILSRSGLVESRRESRSIIYRAELQVMQKALRFMLEDCCGGNPEMCEALLTDVKDTAEDDVNTKINGKT